MVVKEQGYKPRFRVGSAVFLGMLCVAIRRMSYMLPILGALAQAQDRVIDEGPEILHMAPVPSDRFPAEWYPKAGKETKVAMAPVVGKPYSAVTETVNVGRSESGERERWVTLGFQARDRSGRFRSESRNGTWGVKGEMVATKRISVGDPVSHCSFEWTELETKIVGWTELDVALVTCYPQALYYKDFHLETMFDLREDGTSTQGDTTTKIEDLAPLQVDGVKVDRLLVTNSSVDAKGLAKKWSTETWYSLDLQEIIRTGDEESYEGLKEICLTDPDPKLFYPPAGFKIELKTLAK